MDITSISEKTLNELANKLGLDTDQKYALKMAAQGILEQERRGSLSETSREGLVDGGFDDIADVNSAVNFLAAEALRLLSR